jgi:hypothetical protein
MPSKRYTKFSTRHVNVLHTIYEDDCEPCESELQPLIMPSDGGFNLTRCLQCIIGCLDFDVLGQHDAF